MERFDEVRQKEETNRDDRAAAPLYRRPVRIVARIITLASLVAGNLVPIAAHADAATEVAPRAQSAKRIVPVAVKPSATGEVPRVSPYVLANRRHLQELKAKPAPATSRPMGQAHTPVVQGQ